MVDLCVPDNFPTACHGGGDGDGVTDWQGCAAKGGQDLIIGECPNIRVRGVRCGAGSSAVSWFNANTVHRDAYSILRILSA